MSSNQRFMNKNETSNADCLQRRVRRRLYAKILNRNIALTKMNDKFKSEALTDSWMLQALHALECGQDTTTFLSQCHPDNRRRARAAYKAMQRQIRYGVAA